MLAVEIITKAFILSGIVARDLEQVGGSEGADGLFWLNNILAEKSMTGDLLPYYGHLEMNAVIGQESYFVDGLVTLDAVTFNIGSVRYSLVGENRRSYFGCSRPENIDSLPYKAYFERVPGGSQVYFYFFPADTYLLKFTGLISLAQVTFDTEFNGTLDQFYQSYLIFDLANRLCQWYKITLPPQTKFQLDKMEASIRNLNAMDVTVQYNTTLGKSSILSFAQINLSPGWTAP